MAMRDLVTGGAACAAPWSSSSSKPLSALVDAFVGSKAEGMERRVVRWLGVIPLDCVQPSGWLSQPKFWEELIKHKEEAIGHRVWVKVEGLLQRSSWSVELEATRRSLFDALKDATMLAVITTRLHFPHEFRGTPFIVLPMLPGQGSGLDYPVVGGALTATFMGISTMDVVNLQKQRFLAFDLECLEFSTSRPFFWL